MMEGIGVLTYYTLPTPNHFSMSMFGTFLIICGLTFAMFTPIFFMYIFSETYFKKQSEIDKLMTDLYKAKVEYDETTKKLIIKTIQS